MPHERVLAPLLAVDRSPQIFRGASSVPLEIRARIAAGGVNHKLPIP